jgi:formylglycine-generating enzyme required for sulfatase activity
MCRAGSTNLYYFGDSAGDLRKYAIYNQLDCTAPSEVGKKTPNAWGLYDILGNVKEWCQDLYAPYTHPLPELTVDPVGSREGAYQILRGGSWADGYRQLLCAYRAAYKPETKANTIGLRIVLGRPLNGSEKE